MGKTYHLQCPFCHNYVDTDKSSTRVYNSYIEHLKKSEQCRAYASKYKTAFPDWLIEEDKKNADPTTSIWNGDVMMEDVPAKVRGDKRKAPYSKWYGDRKHRWVPVDPDDPHGTLHKEIVDAENPYYVSI